MRRLLLADFYSYNNDGIKSGHYFALGDNYIKVLENSFDVVLAGGPIYKKGFSGPQLLNLPCETLPNQNFFKEIYHIFRNCYSLMKQTTSDDVIVVQVAKPASSILALLFLGRKDRNIFLIQYDTSAICSKIKKFIFESTKRYIKGIICPNEYIGKAFNLPYCVVTDYIYTGNEDIANTVPYEEKKFDFVMVGRIEREKGIVEAAEKLAGTKYNVLIAGKAPNDLAEILSRISNSCNNIDLRLGFVSNEEYISYLRQSKYCLLNYNDVYANRSSGVVLDTIFAGTPVVGRRCMATEFIKENHLGFVYDDLRVEDIPAYLNTNSYSECIGNIGSYLRNNKQQRDKLSGFIMKNI